MQDLVLSSGVRIGLWSDLHLEFRPLNLKPPDCDVLILAGDIQLGLDHGEWIKALPVPVIYIAGNHEFYRQTMDKCRKDMKAYFAHTNVTFLDNNTHIRNNVRFLGSTLWTDFELNGPAFTKINKIKAKQGMADYKHIFRTRSHPLTPAATTSMNRTATKWLFQELAQPFEGSTVVITHHAPSPKAIVERYHMHPLNSAYANDLDDQILNHKIDVWCHGHIHTPTKYKIGNTRCYANPHGYYEDPEPGFQQDLIIEV